jgi:hypothetical protein
LILDRRFRGNRKKEGSIESERGLAIFAVRWRGLSRTYLKIA